MLIRVAQLRVPTRIVASIIALQPTRPVRASSTDDLSREAPLPLSNNQITVLEVVIPAGKRIHARPSGANRTSTIAVVTGARGRAAHTRSRPTRARAAHARSRGAHTRSRR